MHPQKLIEALHTAEKLKDTTRHCYTTGGRHESVAEHSWRISLMALWLRDEFPNVDMDKVTRMCLIHDLGECFTGDIPTFHKTNADEKTEERLLYAWVDTLPEPTRSEMRALYDEMAALQTPEAKIYKALDKMEAVLAHNESDITSWAPNEYSLNLTYGQEQAAWNPYLAKLREAMRQETLQKIERESHAFIRKAQPDDIPLIEAIYDHIHTAEESGSQTIGWVRGVYPVRATAEAALQRGDLFVMQERGQLLGTAIINQVQVPDYAGAAWQTQAPDNKVCVLHTLVIDPAAKGKGCGKAFVAFYEQYALQHGWHELRMDTNARNAAARAMYKKLGFREIGMVPTTFNGIPGVELILLEKTLDIPDSPSLSDQ